MVDCPPGVARRALYITVHSTTRANLRHAIVACANVFYKATMQTCVLGYI